MGDSVHSVTSTSRQFVLTSRGHGGRGINRAPDGERVGGTVGALVVPMTD